MIYITNKAEKYISEISRIFNKNNFKIDVLEKGCVGKSFYLSVADENELKNYRKISVNEKFFIYFKDEDVVFLEGLEIDCEENSAFGYSLSFKNRNAKKQCGCGKSFMF